ncbi:MAG TPA: hypothetical protein VIK00_04700 [Candidatus Limnocylindrales bacterium]
MLAAALGGGTMVGGAKLPVATLAGGLAEGDEGTDPAGVAGP